MTDLDLDIERVLRITCDTLATQITRTGIRADSCILHTRSGLHVMQALGIPAYALAVRLTVLNPPMYVRSRRGEHPTEENQQEWLEAGCWSLRVGFRKGALSADGSPGYDGHLVMVVMDKYIVDLSASQFNRPAKGITGLAPFYGEAEDFIAERHDHIATEDGNGNALIYLHHDDLSYLYSPDWRGPRADAPWVQETVRAIVADATRSRAKGHVENATDAMKALDASAVSASEAFHRSREAFDKATR